MTPTRTVLTVVEDDTDRACHPDRNDYGEDMLVHGRSHYKALRRLWGGANALMMAGMTIFFG